MEQYNEEYTSATTPDEIAAIDLKYEKIITDAEKIMEAAYEKQFHDTRESIEAEMKEIDDELNKNNHKEEKDDEFTASMNAINEDYKVMTAKELTKKYHKKVSVEFAEWIGVKNTKGKEIDIVRRSLDLISLKDN